MARAVKPAEARVVSAFSAQRQIESRATRSKGEATPDGVWGLTTTTDAANPTGEGTAGDRNGRRKHQNPVYRSILYSCELLVKQLPETQTKAKWHSLQAVVVRMEQQARDIEPQNGVAEHPAHAPSAPISASEKEPAPVFRAIIAVKASCSF